MMEHINNPYGNLNIGLKYWIINVAILEIIFIFFYYICFPYRITVIIFYGIGVVFSIANYLGKVVVSLWGRNLSNTRYNTFAVDNAATGTKQYFAQRGNPIQCGVDVRMHF